MHEQPRPDQPKRTFQFATSTDFDRMVDGLHVSPFGVPYVVYDTETNGLNPFIGARVVEIAFRRIDPNGAVYTFDSLVNPGEPIPEETTDIHGISDADVEGKPAFEDIVSEVLPMLDGAVLVAHNSPFDNRFLRAELQRAGHPTPMVPVLDTLRLARTGGFSFRNNKLTTIAGELGLNVREDAHRAAADVEMTADVLMKMIEALNPESAYDLLTIGGEVQTLVPVVAQEIIDVLSAHEVVTIDYRKKNNAVTSRTITALDIADGYISAYCHLRRDDRVFRIDRIASIRHADDTTSL